MSGTTSWLHKFDTAWELSNWLSDYGTVYAPPEHENNFENTYNGFIEPNKRPDFFVDFTFGPFTACFVCDGEDIDPFSRALGPNGPPIQYILDQGHGHITDHSGNWRVPTSVAIITQFSPFGRLTAEENTPSNSSVNEFLPSFDPDMDYTTQLLFHTHIEALSHVFDVENLELDEISRYGAIIGDPAFNTTVKPPTGLFATGTGTQTSPSKTPLHNR